MDRISVLPDDLKCKILSFLSTKEAQRTSMLSSKWRDTWSGIPEVSLVESGSTPAHLTGPERRRRFIGIVNKVLGHPNRLVIKFGLELSSKLYNSKYLYQLPTILYSCNVLTSLKLSGCEIELPTGLREFGSLRVLELEACSINDNDLKNLLSSCPNLEEFVMKIIWERRARFDPSYFNNPFLHIKIVAPKLKKLIISSDFVRLQLDTPCLVKAYFEVRRLVVDENENGARPNLVDEAFRSLSEIEDLSLHYYFLRYLGAGSLPRSLSLGKLVVLTMEVDYASSREAAVIRFLLKNASNLRELHLNHRDGSDPPDPDPQLWQIDTSVTSMSRIRVIESHCFKIGTRVMAFLRYILACTPWLQQLSFRTFLDVNPQDEEALVAELRIAAASVNVLITVESYALPRY